MKPTKNRIYCRDCGRVKMLFESEKAANTFMKFNSEEIAELNGHAPIQSYFCIACNGWHVTSHPEEKYAVSRTERVLDSYKVFKEKQVKNREALVIRNREMREIRIASISRSASYDISSTKLQILKPFTTKNQILIKTKTL